MLDIDPKIPLKTAIRMAGNQSQLAKKLNLNKTSVTDWKNAGLQFLPPLHAYRFRELFPDAVDDNPQTSGTT